jgi:tRNA (guanine-N7-)-methyltransferase
LNDPAGEEANRSRHIRSFSGRRGHITGGQRQAYEAGLPRFGIPYGRQPLNLEQAFGRSAPTVLEIGFGMGDSTAAVAAARPDTNYLGIEVYPAGIGSLLRQVTERSLSNVRVIAHDAFEVVRDMIAPGTLAGVHLWFPDPWPKARHHKRRLIQPPFTALLASRLASGGYLHLATDWEPYAQQMLQVLSAEPLLANTCESWSRRPEARPLTKFERRGLARGHAVRDLMFVRRADGDRHFCP